jgi:DNA-binding transcriptional ArsR family regulator
MGNTKKTQINIADCAIEISSIMRLLASPSRLRIALLIREQALSVGDIAKRSKCSQSQTSQLLAQFLRRGMVTRTQKNRLRTYKLTNVKLGRTIDLIQKNLLNQPKREAKYEK